MNRALHAAIAAAAVVGCVLVIDDNRDNPVTTGECSLPDGDVWQLLADGGLRHVSNPSPGLMPACPQFGDGGGDGSVHPTPALDGGPEIGAGQDGDNGTTVLVLLRVDQGTANLADALETLLTGIKNALTGQDFAVGSVAIADLYTPQHIWALRPSDPVTVKIADVIRGVSASRTATPPTACTTARLQSEGSTASSWYQNGLTPFTPAPAALLVVLIDAGARPQPLGSCASSMFASDPVTWVPTQRRYRMATRFLMIATPESGDAAAMRAHCLAVPNFPTEAIDVIGPSTQAFFDPWSSQMSTVQAGLATRVDLCDALGTGAQLAWDRMAQEWRQQLGALQ